MPSPQFLKEIGELMNFISMKSKEVKSPMSISDLVREFRAKTGTMLSNDALSRRIIRNREKIPHMDELDINTKVRMMFVTSASVDSVFLSKLREQADVKVDGARRIVRYKSNDGSLNLDGNHRRSAIRESMWANEKLESVVDDSSGAEDDIIEERQMPIEMMSSQQHEEMRTMMKFVAEKTKNVENPMSINGLSRQYSEEVGSFLTVSGIRDRINRYRLRIHEMDEFDIETKVKMMFATSVPVDVGFLAKLRKQAEVVVDEMGRITRYSSGRFELNGTHSFIRRSMRARRMNTRFFSETVDKDKKPSRGRKTARSSKNVSVKIEVDEMADDLDYEYEALNNTMDASIIEEHEPSIEDVSEVKQEPMEVTLVGDQQNQNKEALEPMKTNRIPVKHEPAKRVINSPTVRPGEESSIAVRDMLVALRGPLTAIRSPLIQDTLMNIELKIRELELANKRFPLQKVIIPFSTCLYVLTENAVSHSPSVQYSTSLRDFLICLRAGISQVRHPSMDSFHQELETLIQELTTQDKRVRLDTVHRAVSIAFLTIAP